MIKESGKRLLNIVGSSSCVRCKMAKNHLDIVHHPYNYIDASSEEGKKLVAKYNIDDIPYIFEQGKTYTLQEVLALG